MSNQPQADEIRCAQCRHARGVRVDRSFTNVQCGKSDCPKFKAWTRPHEESGDCPHYEPHTARTQKRYETAWKISADRIDAFWRARRFDQPYDGKLSPVPHSEELIDLEPVMRPAPVMLDEISENV